MTMEQLVENKITCIILTAGHSPRLALDIEKDRGGRYAHLQDVPKALLPGPGGKKILDHWWQAISVCSSISEVLLVTTADKYKHFERWASAASFPLSNIVNDGSTLPSNSLGAVGDLELAVRTRRLWDSDVLVVAGDMIYQIGNFELSAVLDAWGERPTADLAVHYTLQDAELTTSRGIVELDPTDGRVTRFLEKPLPSATGSRDASVVFYGLRSAALQLLPSYKGRGTALGGFMEHIINTNKRPVYGHHVATGFQLIGDVSLQQYLSWLSIYSTQPALPSATRGHTARAYARVGLMGNPSDGFHGKTIALTIANFWADVTIEQSATLRLVPHPLNDPTEFGSLRDLHGISSREGYLGGLRLLQATCKMFYHYCQQHSITLHQSNFTLQYNTNIPRQVGLAGSSAIVTATLHALMAYYGLTSHHIPEAVRPQLVLDVETEELCINAGLQDRVVQVYEGLVYMDFSPALVARQGHGHYEHVVLPDGVPLPRLFLAYRPDPSDSGRMHSDVRARWLNGDSTVVQGMAELATITQEALQALLAGDCDTLGRLMQRNFRTRQRMYGSACLGASNLRMIELGEQFGASVKFPGSGGAVLGLVTSHTDMEGLRAQYQAEGCVVVDVIPHLEGKRTTLCSS